MNIRLAKNDIDKANVYRLRYELYVEDQGIFGSEANHERRWLHDEYDDCSQIWLAEVDGMIVGTIRGTWGRNVPFSADSRRAYHLDCFRGVVDEGDIVLITRLLIRPEYRGSDLAIRLFQTLVAHARQSGAALVLGSCEPHLVSHYLRFGLLPYGRLDNHATNGVLVCMMLVIGDLPTSTLESIAAIVEDAAVRCEEVCGSDLFQAELIRRRGADCLGGILDELLPAEAGALLAGSLHMECEPGHKLIGQGHTSRSLYLLLSGSLDVVDQGKTVARMEQVGATVGEVAFLTPSPRMYDVVIGPGGARVLALNSRTLRKLLASTGPVAAKFMHFVARQLCKKLQQANLRPAHHIHESHG